ncbi:uncharacterized protein LOC129216523 [Uloborus diversus]|uniref:uncharacterized protein LOC129216523 n=1 Tax=Uloborus diversus TaxID=327109 RepID=UPI00240A5503|nr:uncharacterized protein LOC129216523 [Uloborus diversus]
MKATLVIVLLSAFSSSVFAECDFENFRCCITEFLRFVSPSGITLTEKNLNSSCTVRNETIECLEDFEDQCLNEDNKDFGKTINDTKAYVDEMCTPESDFILGVRKNENCFKSSSTSFEQCLKTKITPQSIGDKEESHWNAICWQTSGDQPSTVLFAENMNAALLIVALSACPLLVSSDCDFEDFRCCLSGFLNFIDPSGIRLTEQNIATSCTLRDEAFECFDNFEDQCLLEEIEVLKKTINQSKEFLTNVVCSQESDFISGVTENQACFEKSSKSFQSCFNRSIIPEHENDDDETQWKVSCCEYKNLRNCAIEVVENNCGAKASQLIHDEVIHINGAGLEALCGKRFDQCTNSGVNLVSSIVTVLLIYFVATFSML